MDMIQIGSRSIFRHYLMIHLISIASHIYTMRIDILFMGNYTSVVLHGSVTTSVYIVILINNVYYIIIVANIKAVPSFYRVYTKVDSLYFADNSKNPKSICKPIWLMKMNIYSNILPKCVRSAFAFVILVYPIDFGFLELLAKYKLSTFFLYSL